MAFTAEQMRRQVEEMEKGIPYAHKTKARITKAINGAIKEFLCPNLSQYRQY